MTVTSEITLAARIQRLEDRNAISDVVITYATSIDRGDWETFASVFTDPVHIDFSAAGLPAADFSRADFAGFARQGLEVWTARQHLSPNHVVTFDDADPDKALCRSYLYAQHHHPDAAGVFLMRGSYDNAMVRTADGWKITALTQHISWIEGDRNAPPS
jgi:hypothetical protein